MHVAKEESSLYLIKLIIVLVPFILIINHCISFVTTRTRIGKCVIIRNTRTVVYGTSSSQALIFRNIHKHMVPVAFSTSSTTVIRYFIAYYVYFNLYTTVRAPTHPPTNAPTHALFLNDSFIKGRNHGTSHEHKEHNHGCRLSSWRILPKFFLLWQLIKCMHQH